MLLKLTKISPVLAFFRQDGATTGHWDKKMQLVHMVHAVVVTCNMFKTCPDLWWLLLQFFPSLKRPHPSCPWWLKLRISTAGKSGHNMALNVPLPRIIPITRVLGPHSPHHILKASRSAQPCCRTGHRPTHKQTKSYTTAIIDRILCYT